MSANPEITPEEASGKIDERIAELGDWRGEVLARVCELIHAAVPDVIETWKWRGVPVWESDGIICTGETYKNYVKLTFARSASLPDLDGLFNYSLTGNTRRAIDTREGEMPDEKALSELIVLAARENSLAKTRKSK